MIGNGINKLHEQLADIRASASPPTASIRTIIAQTIAESSA